MESSAVFLDRDGTIIEDRGYISDPEQVSLIPGAAEGIRRFSLAGHLVVVVSNQSGIARGLLDESALAAVHERVEALLKAAGAHLDGAYYCPYLAGPEATVEAYRRTSDLRKPAPGMLFQAAREMNIDLSRSWMIGDSLCDLQAAEAAGCRAILIDRGEAPAAPAVVNPAYVAGSLIEAAALVEHHMQQQADEKKNDTPTSREDEIVGLLAKIHEQLEHTERRQRQQDFSVLRLFGALLQMFAVVAAVWGFTALLGDQSAPATARLLLACFFQLASIGAFAIDRFR